MSTTTPAPPGPPAVPHRAGRIAVATLFAVMAALLLTAALVPLLSGPGSGAQPQPVPAPAPRLPR